MFGVNLASVSECSALGLLCAEGTLAGIPGPKVGGFQGIPRDSRGFLAEKAVVHIQITWDLVGKSQTAVGIPPAEQDPFIILNKLPSEKPERERCRGKKEVDLGKSGSHPHTLLTTCPT